MDLPRYDVRYIIDRKRRNRSRRRSSSFESISGRKRGRSSSRGRRHCSSSSSDSSPSLPSHSVVTTSERKKVRPMSKSARRRRRSRASNSPDLGRGLRHDVGHRRSISPLPRRRKRSTQGSEDNTVVLRHSPSVSRGTKRLRKFAVRSGSNDSEIIILPKKKSNKIIRTSELISKKTGKREKITSNACGAVGSKNKKSKKKTASKQIDITSAAAATRAVPNPNVLSALL